MSLFNCAGVIAGEKKEALTHRQKSTVLQNFVLENIIVQDIRVFKNERRNRMKEGLCTMIGIIGSFIASLFGGFDAALITLMMFMGIDYISGLIVAGVFHKSNKTKSGALESRAGWKGLCRKGMTLVVVLIAVRLDLIIGSTYVRDAVCLAFVANETISIIENAGIMGVPIPTVLTKAIEVLKNKQDKESEGT